MSDRARRPLTHDELLIALSNQLGFLRASAAAYDSGLTAEASRLALTMRVLLHDTSRSASLLGVLGIKSKMRYADKYAGMKLPPETSVFFGLPMSTGPNGFAYHPNLEPRRHSSDFETWWNGIALVFSGVSYTRRSLILSAADEDGGAHVDASLSEDYAAASRDGQWTVFGGEQSGTKSDAVPVPALIRQFAYEIDASLSNYFANGSQAGERTTP